MKKLAFKRALPLTIPIFFGYIFLGMTYGIYMKSLGFPFYYSIIMSIIIYGGTAQFLAGGLLLSSFDPIGTAIVILLIHARHLFYGLSMLDKFKDLDYKKYYIIFGMTDETFSLNLSSIVPEGVDKSDFYFFITLLDHIYWIMGTVLGALLGSYLKFDTTGIDFVLTALFLVIFLERFLTDERFPSYVGIISAIISIIIFGKNNFMIIALLISSIILIFVGVKNDRI